MSGRAGWTRVALGDVVRLVRERSSDPENDGFERFVGLEHIDPEDLRIRRWGYVSDGTTFTNVFRAGQVLFGKRRAYQRKVAVADFDGVCSSDIYVFEPSNDQLLPELLPFLCQTERFFEYAVGTSAGSLSPRTNWNNLATFEFPLAPIQEQHRLARILEAIHRCEMQFSKLASATDRTRTTLFQEVVNTYSGRTAALADVATISVGLAISTSEYYRPQGVPLLRNQNIRPSGLDDREILFLEPTFAIRHKTKMVRAGDVVATRTGANIGDACVVPAKYEGAHTFTTLIARVDRAAVHPNYLAAHMNSPIGRAEIDRLSTSGGKNNLNVGDFRRYQLVLPPLEEQVEVCNVVESLGASISSQVLRHRELAHMRTRVAADGFSIGLLVSGDGNV